MKKASTRETALKIVYRTLEEGGYSNILLDHSLSSGGFSPEDRAFITRLVYGVLENKLYLDWVIGRFSKIKLKKLSPWILNILRISIYQIIFMDKVPHFAAVNEGVELAKKYGARGTAGFVNGVLRSVLRNPERTKIPAKEDKPVEHISLKYSHPAWMVENWVKTFGTNFTEELCRANNVPADLVIRTNTLKISVENLIKRLNQEGVTVKRGRYTPVALVIEKTLPLDKIQAFREGLFYVQDESSMLAVEVLGPEPGQVVVDVCSAPGGKATYAAQIMGDRGSIIARDINRSKLKMVQENCSRLGIKSVTTQVYDAEVLDNTLIGKADRVLVDAPCSGLGIIRRKPDIKWKKDREHYNILSAKQRKILGNAARYLRPGGYLVYSTCTIMPEENQMVFEEFLKENPSYTPCDITELVPEPIRCESCKWGYIQLFPNVHQTDGFFIGKLMRKS